MGGRGLQPPSWRPRHGLPKEEAQDHAGVAQVREDAGRRSTSMPKLMVPVWMPLAQMARALVCTKAELHVDLWEAAAPSQLAGGRGMALADSVGSRQERALEVIIRLGALGHAVGQAHVAVGACLPVRMPLAPMTREILVRRKGELHEELWEAAAPSRQAGGRGMALSDSVGTQQERTRELPVLLGVVDHAVNHGHVAVWRPNCT